MGTTKILVVANMPGTLHRVEETLAGLELQTASRLRDAAKAVRQSQFGLLVFCLAADEQSAVDLFAAFVDARQGARLPVVCLAPAETPGEALRRMETKLRAAGAADFIPLADYPRTTRGNDQLRVRILASLNHESDRAPQLRTPQSRTLERAIVAAGSPAKLAAHLGVPERSLRAWVHGGEEPPEEAFLAALDLVLADLERGSRKPS